MTTVARRSEGLLPWLLVRWRAVLLVAVIAVGALNVAYLYWVNRCCGEWDEVAPHAFLRMLAPPHPGRPSASAALRVPSDASKIVKESGCAPPEYNDGLMGSFQMSIRPGVYRDRDLCRNALFKLPFEQALPCDFLPIHMYWRPDLLPWGRLQSAVLLSYLATQDLERTHVYLWTSDPAKVLESPGLWQFLEHVSVLRYDAKEVARGTPLEGWEGLDVHDGRAYADGDLFRILILHKFGGMYVDTDVLLFRDLAPLVRNEFVYQWGGWDGVVESKESELLKINGAMMRMRPGSRALQEMMEELRSRPLPSSADVSWGKMLYPSVLYRRVPSQKHPWPQILPLCFFDPEWVQDEVYKTVMYRQKAGIENRHYAFLEAFGYHFHLSEFVDEDKLVPDPGSRFEMMERHLFEQCVSRRVPACLRFVEEAS